MASQSFFLVMAYVVCFSLGMVLAIALYMFIFNCSLFIRNFDLKPVRFVTAFLTLFVGFRLLLA